MAMTVDQFGKAIVASGLVSADELKAIWAGIADARPKDGEGLAKLLVHVGKLTSYQAREVLAGRGARLIMGDYKILTEIGSGGMGKVFQAQHRRMKRIVALKVMSSAAMKDEAAVRRFQREVEAAARLEHPNIVTAYDSGDAGDVKYLVMQFVDGGDLSQLVKESGPLEIERAVDYVLQTARGLAYAHSRGVIHRDIKPANLLLHKDGTVKVLDMGLARMDDGAEGLTVTDQVMGTVDYMSPEQATDTKNVDARADIYGLGCTLWYLLTGKKVHEGATIVIRLMKHRDALPPSLVKERDDVPWPLEQAFHKMIAKLPQDRHQTMDEVIAALSPYGGGSSSGASAVGGSVAHGRSAELASFMQTMGSVANKPTIAAKAAKSTTIISAAELEAAAGPELAGTDVANFGTPNGIAPNGIVPSVEVDLPRFPNDFGRGAKAVPSPSKPASMSKNSKSLKPAATPTLKPIAIGLGAAAFAIVAVAGVVLSMREDPANEALSPAGSAVRNGVASPAVPVANLPPIAPAATKPGVPIVDVNTPFGVLTSPDYVWSEPVSLGAIVNSASDDRHPWLSADGLTLLFDSNRPGGHGDFDLWECRRPTVDAPWSAPVNLGPNVNTEVGQESPSLCDDDLRLFYSGLGGPGATESAVVIIAARRTSKNAAWNDVLALGQTINGEGGAVCPKVSFDGLTLIYGSTAPVSLGENDLWFSTRKSTQERFIAPAKMRLPINSKGDERSAALSADNRVLIWASDRDGSSNGIDLYQSTRDSAAGVWSAPVSLGSPVNSMRNEEGPAISFDGRTLLFSANGDDGNRDLFESHRVLKNDPAKLADPLQPPIPKFAMRTPVELLPLVDETYDILGGRWNHTADGFEAVEKGIENQLLLPVVPGDGYDVRIAYSIERGNFSVTLPIDRTSAELGCIQDALALKLSDPLWSKAVRGPKLAKRLDDGKRHELSIELSRPAVGRVRIVATIDGLPGLDWEGAVEELTLRKDLPASKNCVMVNAFLNNDVPAHLFDAQITAQQGTARYVRAPSKRSRGRFAPP